MVIWEVFSTIYNIFLYTDFFYTILEEKTKEQGVPKLIKKRDCIVNIYLLLASITQRRNSFFFFSSNYFEGSSKMWQYAKSYSEKSLLFLKYDLRPNAS